MLLSIIYANDLSSTTTIHDSDFTCTQHTSQMFSYCWIYVKNVFNNNECIKESKATLHSCDQEVGQWCCGHTENREGVPSTANSHTHESAKEKEREHLENAKTFMSTATSQTTMR